MRFVGTGPAKTGLSRQRAKGGGGMTSNQEPAPARAMSSMLRTSMITTIVALVLFATACGDDAEATATTLAIADSTTQAPTTTTLAATTTLSPVTTAAPAPVEETVTGVVIAVEGNLAGIDSFVIRLPDGSDLTLVPIEGLLFDGVAPLSHVRDHLVSGNPVSVKYLTSSEGQPIATAVGDAE